MLSSKPQAHTDAIVPDRSVEALGPPTQNCLKVTLDAVATKAMDGSTAVGKSDVRHRETFAVHHKVSFYDYGQQGERPP